MTNIKLYLGECTVDYEGRAESHLAKGDRLVLIQPSVVTVHSLDEKVNPVNYMKDAHTVINNNKIVSTRSNPNESLIIKFSRIDKQVEYTGSDDAELELTRTEAELQEKLHNNPENLHPDFISHEREYKTGAGPVDIRGEIRGEPYLVEVKKNADVSAISQLARYLKADDTVNGIIASHEITATAAQTLNDYDNIIWRKV
jgi:RecB family endonuclease NucS